MASTGNVFPQTGESIDRAGLTAWTAPTAIVSDNATDATCNGTGSDYLVARNFDFSAVPDGATITGILVRVEASEHSGGTEPLLAQLQDETAVLVGSSKSTSNEGAISGTTKAVYTYGSTSDAWGATLTPAIVKDPDFGVRFWFTTAHDVRVDYVTVAVEYAVPVTAEPGVGSALLAGLAATLAITANTLVSAGLGVAALAGFAPAISATQNVTVDTNTGGGNLSGFAPAVELGGPVNATPATGATVLGGLAPSVAATVNVVIFTNVGVMVLTGASPDILTPLNIHTGLGAAIVSGLVPTIGPQGGRPDVSQWWTIRERWSARADAVHMGVLAAPFVVAPFRVSW
jgi:hypothetical protein